MIHSPISPGILLGALAPSWGAFANGEILQIVFFSLMFGIALLGIGEAGLPIPRGIDKLSVLFFRLTAMIMRVAPIGAFGVSRPSILNVTERSFFAAILTALIFVAAGPSTGSAQWDSATSRTLVPGIVHRRLVVNSGPWRMNVLEIDLRTAGLNIRGVRANDAFKTRETVRSMVARTPSVIAAVNGDFFNVKTGESENNVVIEGDVIKGVGVTDSPYDSWSNLHSQFGIDWKNHPFIDRFAIRAFAKFGGQSVRIDGINFRQDSTSLVLYTKAVGDSAPVDTLGRDFAWVPLKVISHRGDTLVYRIDGPLHRGGWMHLSHGAAFAAGGMARESLTRIARNHQTVRVITGFSPDRGRLRTIVGGWPRIIREGKRTAEYSDILEGTKPGFSAGRHPRTAIGFNRDSTKLIALTVDGRRESDSGMSLVELADAMLSLGAYEAMAFDGGGSTTMVVEGKVVNRPSDAAGERPVGSALLVTISR